ETAPAPTPAQSPAKPETQEPSFAGYASLYTSDVASFVKAGNGIMKRIVNAREENAEAQKELGPLGLQFAVLGREFFEKLMTTPVWFNKTAGDFISHTYGLKDGER